MYVTRLLSHYQKFPETLLLPPEGPNSGYLVIQDEESETYSFFGMIKNRILKNLPFPQNKELVIGSGDDNFSLLFIPVLNQPLSSNLYYAIQPHGKHKGKAFTCSREEDMEACCCCLSVEDIKPRPLDPFNLYQQMHIAVKGGKSFFHANSVAPDGFPPNFLRMGRWGISTMTPINYKLRLEEAQGLNTSLRENLGVISHLPSEPIVVGKWYCPFMFVKEGTLRDQMKRSVFYEMTLERRWEKIFSCHNDGRKIVCVDVDIEREVVFVDGEKAVIDVATTEGEIWHRNAAANRESSFKVGLRVEIIERIKWEQERIGWIVKEKNEERVLKEERFGGIGEWREYNLYVLVESFILKRMDGSMIMSYDFRHTHQIVSKCE